MSKYLSSNLSKFSHASAFIPKGSGENNTDVYVLELPLYIAETSSEIYTFKKHLPQQLIHIFQTINYICICSPGISLGSRLCFIQQERLRAISPVTLLSIKHHSCSKYKSSCSSLLIWLCICNRPAQFSFGLHMGKMVVAFIIEKWSFSLPNGRQLYSKVCTPRWWMNFVIQVLGYPWIKNNWTICQVIPKNGTWSPRILMYSHTWHSITYKIATKSLILCITRVSNIK